MNAGEPVSILWRGGEQESVHLGHIVVVNQTGRIVFERGEPETAIYARSALKPLQALPLLRSGAASAYDLPEQCIAIATASHSGQSIHVAAVLDLLSKAGLTAGELQCGIHAPYHEPTAREVQGAITALHNNCSGKHAAMLAVCKHMQWDRATYRAMDHPLQSWIRSLVLDYAEIEESQLTTATDGCGLPVWRLPLIGLARVFCRIATSEEPSDRVLRRIIAERPLLIAGEGRLDTELLSAANGQLICKIGGESVHAGAIPSAGVAWAIKISDGNRRALEPAIARILKLLNVEIAPTIANPKPTYNHQGDLVGRLEAAF